MKLLIIAVGSRGDVQPFVAFGRAATAAGHDVVLSAPQGFDAMIRAARLTPAPLPVDFQELLQQPEMQAAFNSLTGRLKAFRWANEIMNDQLSEMWRIGLEVSPDLILYHFKGAMGPYLGRKLGVPALPVALQPGFAATGEYPMFLMGSKDRGPALNRATHRIIHATMRMGTNVMMKRWIKATGAEIGPLMEGRLGYAPGFTRFRPRWFRALPIGAQGTCRPGISLKTPTRITCPTPRLRRFWRLAPHRSTRASGRCRGWTTNA